MSNWTVTEISEIANSYAGGTPNRSKPEYFNGNIPWISSGEVNQASINNTTETITEAGLAYSSAKWVPEDSILVAMYGATAGQVSYLNIKATTNQAVLALLPIEGKVDARFLYYLVNFNRDKILYFAQGSGQPNLNKKIIDTTKVAVPEYSIQQKIAKILSTIDGQIEKTEAIVAKYQAVKQGMLQDLFTRGIDVTTGELRPKYEDAPELYKDSPLGMVPKEWEVAKLYDTVTVLDSMRIPIKQEDRDIMQKGYPYYGASGIIDYVNDFIFDDELILLGEDGENVISRNLPLAFIVKGKIWVNNHAHVFKPNGKLIIGLLVEQLEKFNYSTYVSGSAQPKITQEHLKKINVFVPHEIEQDRIIDSLRSTNKTIGDEQSVLDKLYKLKQGLMSDLLRGRVEVTE